MKVEFEARIVRMRRAAASLATIQLGSQVVSFLFRLLYKLFPYGMLGKSRPVTFNLCAF